RALLVAYRCARIGGGGSVCGQDTNRTRTMAGRHGCAARGRQAQDDHSIYGRAHTERPGAAPVAIKPTRLEVRHGAWHNLPCEVLKPRRSRLASWKRSYARPKPVNCSSILLAGLRGSCVGPFVDHLGALGTRAEPVSGSGRRALRNLGYRSSPRSSATHRHSESRANEEFGKATACF